MAAPADLLRDVPFFSLLDDQEREVLASRLDEVAIPAGHTGPGTTGSTGTGSTGTGSTGSTGTAGATGTGTAGPGTTGTAGTGTAGTGTGSTAAAVNSEIDVLSAPSGAHVMVDGYDTGKITPTTLLIPRKKGTKVSITLRLKGYNSYAFKPVDTGESSQQKAELVKAKTGSTTSTASPTSGNGGRTNGSGTKTGSAARGSGDPDGLMPP